MLEEGLKILNKIITLIKPFLQKRFYSISVCSILKLNIGTNGEGQGKYNHDKVKILST